jgi:hydrogenase maturation protease
MRDNHTLILGIGNTLLRDEGAGIHALNLLERRLGVIPGVIYIDGGTLSFTLAHYIEDCDNMIVFDAAELQSSPGTVKTHEGAEMDAFIGAAKRSAHEVGLLDLFDIARITESLPANRALIGIQPQSVDWDMQPSPPVDKALPVAVQNAVNLLNKWNLIDASQCDIAATHVNVESMISQEPSTCP